jgi:putative ABC transport system permease protein
MLKSYLTTAWRFLLKNRTFSFINIFGLAAGTLCCLYIVLYVSDQYSYDRHHENAKDIYRVTTSVVLVGDKSTNATASPPVAPAMKQDFAEVKEFTRVIDLNLAGLDAHLLRYKDHSFYEKDAILGDSSFFDVFSYHFTNGHAKGALAAPYTVVLLKPTADKLFGAEDPVGKVIEIESQAVKHPFTVTGVVDESLGKSHIRGNLFMTMNSGGIGEWLLHSVNNEWAGAGVIGSYIKLRPGANAAALEKQLPAFLNKYGEQQMKELGMTKSLHLQPVASIHTTPGYLNEITLTVNPSFLLLLLLIAALIQIIACINFMNLSTARASKRAKEVGVRKVIGARRGDLVRQFLGESFLLSLMGVAVALPLLIIAMPFLNHLTRADIQLSLLADYRIWFLLTGLVLITGLVAGSYPAFYLSAFRAIKVIKGNFTSHISAAGLRRGLVVFQFVLSIVLITGIVVIHSQLNYLKNRDLGFEGNQRLVFPLQSPEAIQQAPSFMNDLRQIAEIRSVGSANNYPGQFAALRDKLLNRVGGTDDNTIHTQIIKTDENYIKTLGIRLLAGRDFHVNDSGRILVNETLVKKMGLTPASAVGVRLSGGTKEIFEIAGVVKDYNYNSLRENVKPLVILYGIRGGRIAGPNLIASALTNDYKTLLDKIETIWHKDFAGLPFGYVFLDKEVQRQYEAEITLANIINSFTVMAILISCLGLFGLAAFSAEQRNKEIGIRKVLGASVPEVVRLLAKEFVKLVLLAIIIAVPLAWWGMNKWLEGFAYRVPVQWWMFALAGLLAFGIALFTVSFQAIKAALANPVKSLKAE